MFQAKYSAFVFVLLLVVWQPLLNAQDVAFGQVEIKINEQTYSLEYAHTFEQRALGLMHRESLCDDCGMLFKFEYQRLAGMWMKNTLIPLDVAFISKNGTITDIKTMQPHDLNTTSASKPVLYAWEMNRGWFEKQGIKVGDSISLPKASE
ncbi:DUF192 domain-containing protein [Paraglaciecola aestuariivivens]